MRPRPSLLAAALAALLITPAAGQSARDQAYERMLRNPADAGAALDYVRAALAAGDNEAAIAGLERLLLFGDNPTLRLELAQLYVDIGAPGLAQGHVERALASGRLDPAQRARAERLRNSADRLASPHRFSGSVLAALRYQTNANAGTSSNLVSIGGQPAVTPTGTKAEPDWDAFAVARLEHIYDFRAGNGTVIESSLDLYGSRQFKLTEFSMSSAELRSGIRFVPAPSIPELNIRPYLVAGMSGLSSRIYGTWIGPGVDVGYRLGDGVVAYGLYELRISSYQDVEAAPDGSLQSGDENVMRIGARKSFADGSLGLAELFGRFVSAERSFYAFEELGARLRYALPVHAGEAVTGRAWYAAAGAEFRQRWFDAPDPNVDPNVTRREFEYRLSASLAAPIADSVEIIAQVDWIQISSNLANFDYSDLAPWIGVRWRF